MLGCFCFANALAIVLLTGAWKSCAPAVPSWLPLKPQSANLRPLT
jgi:hypothetical protein